MDETQSLFSKNRERWKITHVDSDDVKKLATLLGIDILPAHILLSRQIGNGNQEDLLNFLNPPEDLVSDFKDITDPDHLDRATHRVIEAIKNKEKMMINGDPDADGIAGASILVTALRHLGADITYDFPVRAREGHGIQVRIIEAAKRDNIKLIITTDCGSKDIDAANYAKEQGIDVIITDHHILGKRLPDVLAVVNPQMIDRPTYFKELSGSGVAFKFVLAIADRLGRSFPDTFIEFLLAVLSFGTLSDRMSLLNPMNRILVNRGVAALVKTKREGLKAIRRICIDERSEIKPRNLSRTIIPRLNAPGRIGDKEKGIPDASIVVDLLTIGVGQKNAKKASALIDSFQTAINIDRSSREVSNAMSTALSVDDINEKRKYLTNKIEEEIEELVEKQCDVLTDRIIMVEGQNWNPGVIGIDTDRLKDRYLRPAIIFTKAPDSAYIRASVRSIPTINMYRLIDQIDEEFEEKHQRSIFQQEVSSVAGSKKVNAFGGHSQACGFTIHQDDLPTFKQMMVEKSKQIEEKDFDYSYEIVDKIPFSDIGPKLISKLDNLMPYGQNFEYPIFYLKDCEISKGKPFGNKYQTVRKPHVRFIVKEKGGNRKGKDRQFPAVGFGLWAKFCDIKEKQNDKVGFDLIFTCEKINPSRREEGRVRLNVMDIRVSGRDNLSLDV